MVLPEASTGMTNGTNFPAKRTTSRMGMTKMRPNTDLLGSTSAFLIAIVNKKLGIESTNARIAIAPVSSSLAAEWWTGMTA